MRLVVFGTPEFAVPAIEALLDSRHDVAGLVCQPDRPRGRSGAPRACAGKEAALERGFDNVLCPEKVTKKLFAPDLRALAPDAAVVVAYGKIFRPWIFEHFPKGMINIHPSLLPKYRGPSPVEGALMSGERETGISIMMLDEGMDTGDVLLQQVVAIDDGEAAGGLSERLAVLAVPLLLEALDQVEGGVEKRVPQDHDKATITRLLSKEDGQVDWARSAWEIHCRIRGVNPWPGARTVLKGKDLLLWESAMAPDDAHGSPGEVIEAGRRRLVVAAGQGAVELRRLQWPGRKPLDAAAFLNGAKLSLGDLLG